MPQWAKDLNPPAGRVAWPSQLRRVAPEERMGPFTEALQRSPELFLEALEAELVKTPALCAAILALRASWGIPERKRS